MHGTLSSLSSIMGATAHYPLFRGLVEQLSVIAAKFGVCTMAPTHTSVMHHWNILDGYIFWMPWNNDDTLKLSCFSLHGSDMFITPSGNTPKSLSTVTHARVRPAHDHTPFEASHSDHDCCTSLFWQPAWSTPCGHNVLTVHHAWHKHPPFGLDSCIPPYCMPMVLTHDLDYEDSKNK